MKWSILACQKKSEFKKKRTRDLSPSLFAGENLAERLTRERNNTHDASETTLCVIDKLRRSVNLKRVSFNRLKAKPRLADEPCKSNDSSFNRETGRFETSKCGNTSYQSTHSIGSSKTDRGFIDLYNKIDKSKLDNLNIYKKRDFATCQDFMLQTPAHNKAQSSSKKNSTRVNSEIKIGKIRKSSQKVKNLKNNSAQKNTKSAVKLKKAVSKQQIDTEIVPKRKKATSVRSSLNMLMSPKSIQAMRQSVHVAQSMRKSLIDSANCSSKLFFRTLVDSPYTAVDKKMFDKRDRVISDFCADNNIYKMGNTYCNGIAGLYDSNGNGSSYFQSLKDINVEQHVNTSIKIKYDANNKQS